MSIIPCGHRVVVKIIPLEEVDDKYRRAKSIGLEIVGDQINREQQSVDKGTVVAIGPTAFDVYGGGKWCEVGDIVAFAKYSGKAVRDLESQEDFLVLNDEDVVCILRKGDK